MDPSDIIEMLYNPSASPDLTDDDVDLILNNYVGTNIDIPSREKICADDTDILSCAKKLFEANASVAILKYSFEFPVQPHSHSCNVSFRFNPDNRLEETLQNNPSACVASRLFPLNNNTVRWLCSTTKNPIPPMSIAHENAFMLDFFRADDKNTFLGHGRSPIFLATVRESAARNSKPYKPTKNDLARRAWEQSDEKREQEAQAQYEYNRRREADWKALLQRGNKQPSEKKEEEPAWGEIRMGGLKQSKRKQSKRKQSKHKQSKRKQSKHKQSKRIK
jgi:hypothetical protein